jgi:hypothetical protein
VERKAYVVKSTLSWWTGSLAMHSSLHISAKSFSMLLQSISFTVWKVGCIKIIRLQNTARTLYNMYISFPVWKVGCIKIMRIRNTALGCPLVLL